MSDHVFKVGQVVKILPRLLPPSSRNEVAALERAQFEIVRLMPATGSIFQYRIKNKATGQERLVTETEILSAEH